MIHHTQNVQYSPKFQYLTPRYHPCSCSILHIRDIFASLKMRQLSQVNRRCLNWKWCSSVRDDSSYPECAVFPKASVSHTKISTIQLQHSSYKEETTLPVCELDN
ncbi:hypothetical protein AMEX_G14189 [Astyanax mexicanus]|uniref:Uncharacterized protein n=1 Tax=Astyanax mexicanus TaxID=7994 RepID=A0A8T2LIG8_ASTMX|nr:hypothetical protein AMEX_G14189 [Astyanax mexicanus]